jgi:glucuronate isomerase
MSESAKRFLGEDYLLTNSTAKALYGEIRDLPIVDAHNHADIREIMENKPWPDLWVIQGATDHYVWELMRRRGVPEEKVTGNASNWEKWEALATVMPELIGNPAYEWVHLDLRRRFGIEEIVSKKTAAQIWKATQTQLQQPEMRPQEVLKKMKVEVMSTTDHPTLKLPYHEQAKKELSSTRITPTWRPDKAMNIAHSQWKRFVEELGVETNRDTSTLDGLLDALKLTHDYFDQVGCVASDHGVQQPHSHPVEPQRAGRIHQKAFQGERLTPEEIRDYQAYMMIEFGRMNAETNWVTQLHIGPVRDYRDHLWDAIGADSGGDISTQTAQFVEPLQYFLNQFDGKLKIVLYCVDPTHPPTLATIARALPNVFVGAPWWWIYCPYGIETHLKYLATVDLLSCLTGMVTDSRKLLSFGSRTEMFRRVLASVLGEMVEKGQAPEDPAHELAASLSYHRPLNLFYSK